MITIEACKNSESHTLDVTITVNNLNKKIKPNKFEKELDYIFALFNFI